MRVKKVITFNIICVLAVLVMVSCYGKTDRVSVSGGASGPLAFVMRDAEYTSYRNDVERTPDAWVKVSCPEVICRNDDVACRINEAVIDHAASLLAGYVSADYDSTAGIEMLASLFLKSHADFIADFPDAAVGHEWQCEISGSVLHSTKTCVTVAFTLFAYTGGAHPMHGTTILSFDTATGALLTLDDIVSDREAFAEIAEREFRRTYNIPHGASLNESGGFMFDDNIFSLTENFGVQGDGLRFIYPLYEVAAYVYGIIEFDVPLESASELIVRKDLFK